MYSEAATIREFKPVRGTGGTPGSMLHDGANGTALEWRQKLEASGLTVLDCEVPDGFPEVMSAIYAVNGFEVEPTVVVSESLPDASAQLDREWAAQIDAHHLITKGNAFYILAPVARGHEVGWIHVRDPIGSDLPSRIHAGTGNTEFMAVSEDGRVMCAVSTEESETWIVVHRFP
ncbi:hypothetical protein ACFV9D_18740 [Streptomyces sp. NPDC059875]|uniref:hypothetical protein n=1 Tax=unclassified Streptomyces TaxID=2593676 RepID=UPI00365424C2